MSGERGLRAFVACPVTDEIRRRLAEAARDLDREGLPFRWVRPSSVHLTLKFLGNVAEADLGALRDAVRGACDAEGGFTLPLGGLGAFPTPRRARVLWWGFDRERGSEALTALGRLAERVERSLAPLGHPPEGRPFTPHLTLGRLARDARPPDVSDALHRASPLPPDGALALPVGEVRLYRSRLAPTGARYEVLDVFPLGTLPGDSERLG